MKNQQEAERAEQQRIKNLVLNYDLQDSSSEQAGTGSPNSHFDPFSHPNPNIRSRSPQRTTLRTSPPPRLAPWEYVEGFPAHTAMSQGTAGDKHQHNASLHQSSPHHNATARPPDKSSSNRSGHRARKLQLSDVDWYDRSENANPTQRTENPDPSRGRGRGRGGSPRRGSSRGGFRGSGKPLS